MGNRHHICEVQKQVFTCSDDIKNADNLGVEDVDSNDEDDDLEEQMAQRYGERIHDHDLWPYKPHDYSHLYSNLEHMMLTQHNVKKGLKLFGKADMSAVVMEI